MGQRRAPPKLDLALDELVLLDALLVERNVTRAAARVGLSQSAASHALKRMREQFADPLLVRTREGMALTERAKQLAAPLHDALGHLDTALRGTRGFIPASATRRFTIAMSDYLELVVLPDLYERIARDAPRVDLHVVPISRGVEGLLATDSADLVLAMTSHQELAGVYQQRLFDDRYVCVLRRGHPAARRPLTVDAYCALDHLLIAPRGGRGVVDRVLAETGRSRRVAVQIPHWLVAPHVIARSDLVLTVVERLARRYAALLPLELTDLPVDVPATTCWQRWHERSHHDAAHVWLRGLVAQVATSPAA